jgi:tetratricopeptide (TPR) repeat protein
VYRRDISSTLRILAVLLGAFVFYHVWTQPSTTSAPTPASLPSANIDATLNFPPALVEPAPPLDIPRTRLIEFGEAPSAAHQHIRDDLDRGEYKLAETALRALNEKPPAAARDKVYVAALWNNLGVQQEKLGGIAVSVKAFKRAAALAPHHPTALLNLTQAYWGLRHPALTLKFLEEVIQVAKLCGDAGRQLDGDHYRILLLETRRWLREAVTKLTQETKATDLNSLFDVENATAYRARVAEWRGKLTELLEQLAERKHLNQ